MPPRPLADCSCMCWRPWPSSSGPALPSGCRPDWLGPAGMAPGWVGPGSDAHPSSCPGRSRCARRLMPGGWVEEHSGEVDHAGDGAGAIRDREHGSSPKGHATPCRSVPDRRAELGAAPPRSQSGFGQEGMPSNEMETNSDHYDFGTSDISDCWMNTLRSRLDDTKLERGMHCQ